MIPDLRAQPDFDVLNDPYCKVFFEDGGYSTVTEVEGLRLERAICVDHPPIWVEFETCDGARLKYKSNRIDGFAFSTSESRNREREFRRANRLHDAFDRDGA